MGSERISLSQAVKFHGHLGPYLVLGILAGELAVKRLKCRKYFGLRARVWGASQKPKSCLIDGLQLSTGATYGKGNIEKLNGARIKMAFYNQFKHTTIILRLKSNLIQQLSRTKTHRDSELLARRLYKTKYTKLFDITT